MATRRNVLTMLGLASAMSPAMATDDLVHTTYDPSYRRGAYNPERMAVALERLAAEIRAGMRDDAGVNVSRFHIGSEICTDDWLKQTLSIDIEIKGHAA
jgi:hypothetical protein